ncbi:epoxide hydrolase family protein [Amycolatopsis sp. NBC_01480]|uniref:epoxide hydrolase family protein n=1 Tax=Amycolatopsis sp. NBC_01480 TaxID=2903562 RepID=UPI002E28156A|nr:epoxide hydrolase [Amycolatopsis sp. NBC_01480]
MNDEMRDRLQRTRRVTTPWSDDGTRGITSAHLDALLERWANGYDWGVHSRRIAELPWVTVKAGDTELRLIHQRSADPGAPVVVLLHGWPDSVLRFERLRPLLTDAHVVVPALPGFPFAARSPRPACQPAGSPRSSRTAWPRWATRGTRCPAATSAPPSRSSSRPSTRTG